MEPIELVVSGSVADDDTTTITTVHEIQVVDEEVPATSLYVPIDLVVTSERAIWTDSPGRKPTGIDWEALDEERIREISVL
ncbi:MAG: hypothetical protein ACOCTH_03230 [Halodesulfurarchaeum sp.]